MTWRIPLAALMVAAAVLPKTAHGQTPAHTFDGLEETVRRGDTVVVTDETGRTTKGTVSDLTGSALTLTVGKETPTQVFTPDRTTRIVRRDSLQEGILIGLGAGVVVSWTMIRSTCGPPGFDPECSANMFVATVPLSLGVGGGVGALVDAAIRKTVYRSQRSQVTFVPVVSGDQRGALVSIGWK
jgi:hypothetical protein